MPALRKTESVLVPGQRRDLEIAGEEWVPAAQPHAGGYEVSSLGRVRRFTEGHLAIVAQSVRSQSYNTKYLRVNISQEDGSFSSVSVHRLVLLSFMGAPPTAEHQAAHLNGKSMDNRPDNLVWATPQENTDHQIEHGTRLYGESNHAATFCSYAIELVKHLVHTEGWSYARVASVAGASPSSIRRVALDKHRVVRPARAGSACRP